MTPEKLVPIAAALASLVSPTRKGNGGGNHQSKTRRTRRKTAKASRKVNRRNR